MYQLSIAGMYQFTSAGDSYSRVTDFIHDWRGRAGKVPHAFVALKFELGEAFQFD